MAREKSQKVMSTMTKKITYPVESVWSKFPLAINGVHFKTVDNKNVRKMHGKEFLCLIMDKPGIGKNIAKKVSFLRHFWTHHKLNPEPIKQGRPRKSKKRRAVLLEEAKHRAKERLKGDFVARVWRAKKTHLGNIVNWAITMQQGCPDEEDVNECIWDLAVKRYREWRKSVAFTNSITDMAKRTKAYWIENYLDLLGK